MNRTTGLVEAVSGRVDARCRARRCGKAGCSISMERLPCTSHVLIDMDCDVFDAVCGRRCDYVFAGEGTGGAWIAPIELKSGAFRGDDAAEQLQAGADAAGGWLPADAAFTFVPLLAHKGIHKVQHERLRRARIRLRDQVRQPLLVQCGTPLRKALATAGD